MFGSEFDFPAMTTLLTLLIFYIENDENIVTNGFDGVLKTLPSLLLFGLVFKLLVSVVSKGVIYFLIWRFKGQLLQFILAPKLEWLRQILGLKWNMASQRPKRLLHRSQHEVLRQRNTWETLH